MQYKSVLQISRSLFVKRHLCVQLSDLVLDFKIEFGTFETHLAFLYQIIGCGTQGQKSNFICSIYWQ